MFGLRQISAQAFVYICVAVVVFLLVAILPSQSLLSCLY